MKAHRFDALSFITGLVMAGAGLLFLLPYDAGDLIDVVSRAAVWIWPALLLAIGLAVLIPAVTRSRDEETPASGTNRLRSERPKQ